MDEVSARNTVNIFSVAKVAKHLRIFRNLDSGDILILINEEINSFIDIDDAENWMEQNLSPKQAEYFSRCGTKLYYQSSAVSHTSSPPLATVPSQTLSPATALAATADVGVPQQSGGMSYYLFGSSSQSGQGAKTAMAQPEQSKFSVEGGEETPEKMPLIAEEKDNRSRVNSAESDAPERERGNSRDALVTLNAEFQDINRKIDEVLFHITALNESYMRTALDNALTEFKQKASFTDIVGDLCKRVLDINYSNFNRGGLDALKNDLSKAKEALTKTKGTKSNDEVDTLEPDAQKKLTEEEVQYATIADSQDAKLFRSHLQFLEKQLRNKRQKLSRLLRLSDYTFLDVIHKGNFATM
jgi:hypothetical protein